MKGLHIHFSKITEQHERLKSMQCKFREEVAQHLQECQSMLEDVESSQIELKGDAKKQSMFTYSSHHVIQMRISFSMRCIC